MRRDITLGCCEAVPFERLGIILSDAPTMIVADAEIELRVSVTLLRCAPIPFYGLGIILRHAVAFGVHDTEIALRVSETLFCRAPMPLQGLGIILRHAVALAVHDSEIVLRPCIARFGQRSKKRQRGCIVLALIRGECILEGSRPCGIRQHQRQRDQTPTPKRLIINVSFLADFRRSTKRASMPRHAMSMTAGPVMPRPAGLAPLRSCRRPAC